MTTTTAWWLSGVCGLKTHSTSCEQRSGIIIKFCTGERNRVETRIIATVLNKFCKSSTHKHHIQNIWMNETICVPWSSLSRRWAKKAVQLTEKITEHPKTNPAPIVWWLSLSPRTREVMGSIPTQGHAFSDWMGFVQFALEWMMAVFPHLSTVGQICHLLILYPCCVASAFETPHVC